MLMAYADCLDAKHGDHTNNNRNIQSTLYIFNQHFIHSVTIYLPTSHAMFHWLLSSTQPVVHSQNSKKLGFEKVCRMLHWASELIQFTTIKLNACQRGDSANATSLTPPFYTEVPVPSQESERSYICVVVDFVAFYYYFYLILEMCIVFHYIALLKKRKNIFWMNGSCFYRQEQFEDRKGEIRSRIVCGAETAYPSEAPPVLVGHVCSIFRFLCNVLQIVVCPFVLFLLAIVLTVLRSTASDYPLLFSYGR